MTAIKSILLAVILALCGALSANAQESPPGGSTPTAPNLRITAPKNGQKLAVDYVTVQFQVTNPAAAANNLPTFVVTLDSSNPVQTSTSTHTFTGLAPGEHSITVEMVDANSVPVPGTRTEVHFFVSPETSAPVRSGSDSSRSTLPASSGTETAVPQSDLPSAASGLPLLSIIGFGVLVGGIVSALRTR